MKILKVLERQPIVYYLAGFSALEAAQGVIPITFLIMVNSTKRTLQDLFPTATWHDSVCKGEACCTIELCSGEETSYFHFATPFETPENLKNKESVRPRLLKRHRSFTYTLDAFWLEVPTGRLYDHIRAFDHWRQRQLTTFGRNPRLTEPWKFFHGLRIAASGPVKVCHRVSLAWREAAEVLRTTSLDDLYGEVIDILLDGKADVVPNLLTDRNILRLLLPEVNFMPQKRRCHIRVLLRQMMERRNSMTVPREQREAFLMAALFWPIFDPEDPKSVQKVSRLMRGFVPGVERQARVVDT